MPPHPDFPRPETPGRPPWYEKRFQDAWWPNWWVYRRVILNRADGRCEWCGCAEPLDIHHLTYENFGQESFTDLVALCASCHREGDRARLALEVWLGLGVWGPDWYLRNAATWPEPPRIGAYT